MFHIRYKRSEDAKMALEQMEGFELAGRTVSRPALFYEHFGDSCTGQLRVNTVHEKGSGRYTQQDSLEDSGGTQIPPWPTTCTHCPPPGGNLNAASRQALMQKLARTENSSVKEEAL